MKLHTVLGALLLTAPPLSLAAQTSTDVVVRVIARDAKLIGSGVGGVRVTLRDPSSGAVLAEGVQEGSTGETSRIMAPHERGARIYDTDGAAAFTPTVELERPTFVEIVAEGPLGTPGSGPRATRTLLLVPGEHVRGEGIVLELYGFTVELQEPDGAGAATPGTPLTVTARVTMLCGCPTEPGGLWDADDYTIVARLLENGRVLRETPLRFSGTTSVYSGSLTPERSGSFELEVLAMDPAKGNFGVVRRTLVVR